MALEKNLKEPFKDRKIGRNPDHWMGGKRALVAWGWIIDDGGK